MCLHFLFNVVVFSAPFDASIHKRIGEKSIVNLYQNVFAYNKSK